MLKTVLLFNLLISATATPDELDVTQHFLAPLLAVETDTGIESWAFLIYLQRSGVSSNFAILGR